MPLQNSAVLLLSYYDRHQGRNDQQSNIPYDINYKNTWKSFISKSYGLSTHSMKWNQTLLHCSGHLFSVFDKAQFFKKLSLCYNVIVATEENGG